MSIVNLLPEDYLKRRTRRRANVLCLLLFVIVMTGVLTARIVSERNTKHTQEILNRLNAEYADAVRLIDQMQDLKVQHHELQQKADRTASLVETVPRSTILAVVTNARPKYLSLVEVDLVTKKRSRPHSGIKAAATSKFAAAVHKYKAADAPQVVTLKIVGLAATDVEVARFMANLARHPLSESVDLVYSEGKLIEKMPVREFEVTLVLTADMDTTDMAREVEQMNRTATKFQTQQASWNKRGDPS